MSDHVVVLTTFASTEQAEPIIDVIVSERLAACAQAIAATSTYVWKGALEREAEILVLFKTRADRYGELQARLSELHPYETPEILRVPVEGGFAPYLAWVDENTA